MVDGEKAERLKAARIAAGYASAARGALAVGKPYASYASHENGGRGFEGPLVQHYARCFNVDPAWLEFGTTGAAQEPPGAPIRNVEPTSIVERLEAVRAAAQARFERARADMEAAGLDISMLTVAIDRLRPSGGAR